MQTLTMVAVLSAVGKFIKSGKLGGQKHDKCRYNYGDGCRCVIGTGFNDETFAKFGVNSTCNTNRVLQLETDNIILLPKGDERSDLASLQRAHDAWASSASVSKQTRRKAFYKLLHQMRKKYGVPA